MGFYYFILLFSGIFLLFLGAIKLFLSRRDKRAVFQLVLGMVFVVSSIWLFTPGSSEVIAQLLNDLPF